MAQQLHPMRVAFTHVTERGTSEQIFEVASRADSATGRWTADVRERFPDDALRRKITRVWNPSSDDLDLSHWSKTRSEALGHAVTIIAEQLEREGA
jgi:hypothetical protein